MNKSVVGALVGVVILGAASMSSASANNPTDMKVKSTPAQITMVPRVVTHIATDHERDSQEHVNTRLAGYWDAFGYHPTCGYVLTYYGYVWVCG